MLAAMEQYKQAIIASDVAEPARIWTEDYTFINPLGGLVTRAERLTNIASGNTNVQVIDDEREITVRVYGDMAVPEPVHAARSVQRQSDGHGPARLVRVGAP